MYMQVVSKSNIKKKKTTNHIGKTFIRWGRWCLEAQYHEAHGKHNFMFSLTCSVQKSKRMPNLTK